MTKQTSDTRKTCGNGKDIVDVARRAGVSPATVSRVTPLLPGAYAELRGCGRYTDADGVDLLNGKPVATGAEVSLAPWDLAIVEENAAGAPMEHEHK